MSQLQIFFQTEPASPLVTTTSGPKNNVLISREDTLVFSSDQKAIKSFRAQWQYNNLGCLASF
jgi:hypothetical protein